MPGSTLVGGPSRPPVPRSEGTPPGQHDGALQLHAPKLAIWTDSSTPQTKVATRPDLETGDRWEEELEDLGFVRASLRGVQLGRACKPEEPIVRCRFSDSQPSFGISKSWQSPTVGVPAGFPTSDSCFKRIKGVESGNQVRQGRQRYTGMYDLRLVQVTISGRVVNVCSSPLFHDLCKMDPFWCGGGSLPFSVHNSNLRIASYPRLTFDSCRLFARRSCFHEHPLIPALAGGTALPRCDVDGCGEVGRRSGRPEAIALVQNWILSGLLAHLKRWAQTPHPPEMPRCRTSRRSLD